MENILAKTTVSHAMNTHYHRLGVFGPLIF